MKYFCFIFSLYFLALSLMPCTDDHTTTKSSVEMHVSKLTCHTNDSNTDFCSPFCGCATCGQVLAIPKFFKWTFNSPIALNFTEKNSFHFSQDWQSAYLKGIFKPPQAS